MKTSNIILVSFFALIVLVLAFVTGKYFHPNSEEYTAVDGLVEIKEELPHFSHLRVEADARVWLKSSTEQPYLSFKEHEDSLVVMPDYVMKGDTLVLRSVQTTSGKRVSISIADTVSLTVRGRIDVQKPQAHYKVDLQGGRVSIHGHDLKRLELVAQGGRLDYWGKSLERLDAEVANAQLYLEKSQIDDAHISARDHAKVKINQTRNLLLSKDESSKVIVRD